MEIKDEFGLEKSKMLNDPKSIYWPFVVLEMDGDAVCAHLNNFINLHESPAGCGATPKEAVQDLLQIRGQKCLHPMWTGFGGPAGHCGEDAFGSYVHANTLSMFLCDELARCPRHGGFDLSAAAALVLYYRTPNRAEFN